MRPTDITWQRRWEYHCRVGGIRSSGDGFALVSLLLNLPRRISSPPTDAPPPPFPRPRSFSAYVFVGLVFLSCEACAFSSASRLPPDHQPYWYRLLARLSVVCRPSPQTTVPNVFVRGTHVGGNDAVQAANSSGALKTLLEK